MAHDGHYTFQIDRKRTPRIRTLPEEILAGFLDQPLLIYYLAQERGSFKPDGEVRYPNLPSYQTWLTGQLLKIQASHNVGAASGAAELGLVRGVSINSSASSSRRWRSR